MRHIAASGASVLRSFNLRAPALIAVACASVGPSSGCAPRPTTEIPPWLAAQVQVERNEHAGSPHLHVNMQMRGSAPDGCFTAPFDLRDDKIILREVYLIDASAAQTRRRASPVLDTGNQDALSLSRSGAAQYRPWLSAQIGATTSIGALGSRENHRGALGGIRFAGMTLEPVPVSVSSGNSPAMVGMGLLSLFEGVIIDWNRGQLHLVARRSLYSPSAAPSRARLDALQGSAEWSVAPLEIDLNAASNESLRQVILSTSGVLPRTTIRVGGESYTALIDTGFSGDVLVAEGVDWPLGAGRSGVMADIAGRRARLTGHELLTPLLIGESRYREVEVVAGWTRPPGVTLEFDAVIGLGLLRRAPVWLDWHGGEIRIWTGRGEFPDLRAGGAP